MRVGIGGVSVSGDRWEEVCLVEGGEGLDECL